MSTISYLRLDQSYDPIFDPAVALTDVQAVEQAIQTSILLFQGEWWENLNLGTPMFQTILGQRASQTGQQIMSMALAARIGSVPFVTVVQNALVTFNAVTRVFTFSATVQTAFGTLNLSLSPGSLAGSPG